jgi:TIR domain
MKVFISWSGERSRLVAELLDEWIQCVIQAVDPWMSSKDIDRGALWFTEIADQLQNTSLGIVCLTNENKDKPWILFESGALAKGLTSNRVCTFLIDLTPTELDNPLAQFNHTFPTKEGLWNLARTINISLKDRALKEKVLENVFERYWDQFDKDFTEIIKSTPKVEVKAKRKDTDVMIEVLSTVRMLERKIRHLEPSKSATTKMYGSYIDPETPTIHTARELIKDMVIKDFPDEIILMELEALNVPSTWVQNRIARYRLEPTTK